MKVGPGFQRRALQRQRGASMVEFVVVALVILMAGLSLLQYGLLFSAKNTLNYAAFEAARAGAYDHADPETIQQRFAIAAAPLYGGGLDAAELAESIARAQADIAANAQITLINPIKESYDDWASDALTESVGEGARTIQNLGLAIRDDAGEVKPLSGQNLYDANVLKLSIVYGYELGVPIASQMFLAAYQLLSSAPPVANAGASGGGSSDPFVQALVAQGRIPVRVDATMRMESEPIESSATQSNPATGQANPGGGSSTPPDWNPPGDGPPAGTRPFPVDPGDLGGGFGGACLPGDSYCLPPGCSRGDPACDPVCDIACCTVSTTTTAALEP